MQLLHKNCQQLTHLPVLLVNSKQHILFLCCCPLPEINTVTKPFPCIIKVLFTPRITIILFIYLVIPFPELFLCYFRKFCCHPCYLFWCFKCNNITFLTLWCNIFPIFKFYAIKRLASKYSIT